MPDRVAGVELFYIDMSKAAAPCALWKFVRVELFWIGWCSLRQFELGSGKACKYHFMANSKIFVRKDMIHYELGLVELANSQPKSTNLAGLDIHSKGTTTFTEFLRLSL